MESSHDGQGQTIYSDMSNEDAAQWFMNNDFSSDRLRAISDIIDKHNSHFDSNSKPVEIDSEGYSAIRIPEFEYLRKYLGMK